MHTLLKKVIVSCMVIMLTGCAQYEINIKEREEIKLVIDKININQKLSISSITKEVYGIVMFSEYGMPNNNKKIVIGAHSGTGPNAYFNDLNILKYGDIIIINFNNKEYKYSVFEVKEVKNTDVNILNDKNSDLMLLSCKINNDTKRIVAEANKISS